MSKKKRFVVVQTTTYNVLADNKAEAEVFAEYLDGVVFDELIIDENIIPGDIFSVVQKEGKTHKPMLVGLVVDDNRWLVLCKHCEKPLERYYEYELCQG